MLDWAGSSHQDGVLLCELGLACGASLNWDETLLTREVSAGTGAGGSARPNSDLAAMCWRHSSCGEGTAQPCPSGPSAGSRARGAGDTSRQPYLVLEGGVGSTLGPEGDQALFLAPLGVVVEASSHGGRHAHAGRTRQAHEGQQQ